MLNPFISTLKRQEEIIARQEAELKELRDFKDSVEKIIYKGAELDEHGNSKPYRFDHLLMELRAVLNNEPVWSAPW